MTYTPPRSRPGGLRLHLNENTAGCSPAVLAALQSVQRTWTSEYPDYLGITEKCEKFFGVNPGFVQITNGLDEGLHVVAQAARLSRPDFDAIVVEPAFEMYAACIAAVGGNQVTVPPMAGLRFPIDAVIAAISHRTRVIYLCDPNNPSGLPIPREHIRRVADAAPQATVLLDEAFADFSGRTMASLVDRHRNLIVGRTFAKAHGLAALRVGVLIAHPTTLMPIRRILPPFSINVCAAIALRAAMDDRAYVEWYVSEAAQSRDLIYEWCRARGVPFWPSEGNFVLMYLGDGAKACVDALAAREIYIRDKTSTPGCEGCIRITAGLVEDTRVCLAAMEEWYASRGN
jgi:histidinol-phosphate aminotransferase